MCELIGKSKERILCKLSKSEILRLYSIVHVAMETTKTSNFTCQLKSFITIFFTCQVSACELQPFSCHNLANDLYSKPVFRHLKKINAFLVHIICSNETVHVKWCLYKSVRQTENGLKRVFLNTG